MKKRFCVMCGRNIDHLRIDAEFCGSLCRDRASRVRKKLKALSLDLLDALDTAPNISYDNDQMILFARIKARLNM